MNNPFKAIQQDFDEMTPRQKALAAACVVFAGAVNPLALAAYASVYTIYSAREQSNDSEDTSDDS